MSCNFIKSFEITYSYGGHNPSLTKHLYYEDVIQVSRCCLLQPQWFLKSADLLKTEDVFEYLKHLPNKENPNVEINHSMCNGSKCILSDNQDVKEIIVGLSYACNLNCYHCWYAGHHFDSNSQKELYFHVLNSLKNHSLNKITLTNKGEPFFYLEETINYLKNLTINDTKKVSSVTNGNCFDENDLKTLKSIKDNTGVDFNFVFSIDAISSETYNHSRPGGDFEKVLKNLENSAKFFGTENVSVSFTCKKTNAHEASKAKDFYKNNFGLYTDISFDYYNPEIKESLNNE